MKIVKKLIEKYPAKKFVQINFQDFKKYQKMIEGKNLIKDDTDVDSDDDESGVDVLDAEKAADVDGAQGTERFTDLGKLNFPMVV